GFGAGNGPHGDGAATQRLRGRCRCGCERGTGTGMITAASPSERPFVILCIEDEAQLRRDIRDELIEAGYQVIEAGDGSEALARLGSLRPGLVRCDISMRGLDAYGVLEALRRNDQEHAEIPFLFPSALGDPRHIVDGKRLGADDYLV